jgi:hypothetical protein
VSLDTGVIDDFRESHAFLGRHDLPRHPAVQRQDVHLNSMLVHPLAPSVDIEFQRIGIANRLP